ncbi:MAG: UDP-N-acetylmuramate dehydrogenase [Spirosomaceae bacterium]|nr:UDP-N-acetylmuramate dehydrogenase [Spirosomataceae bacterium]
MNLPSVAKGVSLKSYNTFGLEATADLFTTISSTEELKSILHNADYKHIEKLYLGGGSNVLFTKDFAGMVILNRIKGITVANEDENYVWVNAGAGESWHELVLFCVANNYAGMENLSLIPGTVGAAPMQNIGAYGVEIKDIFESLEALNLATHETEIFDAAACKFGYRESVFKHEAKGKYVITNVTFRLNKTPNFHVEYGAIKDTLEEMGVTDLSIKAISDAVIKIRQSKLPNPAEIGNAGSFFKNPEIPKTQFTALKGLYAEMPSYPINESTVKVPAGWLIEQAGWKGKRFGEIGVHAKQALVLVNYGNGKGDQIKALASDIQASVNEKFGINLTPEVNFI